MPRHTLLTKDRNAYRGFLLRLFDMPPKRGSSKKQPELDIPGSSKYPGKTDGKGLEAAHYEACRHILEGVYKRRDDGHLVAEIFRELPDRDDYADYYETIPEPECLDSVAVCTDESNSS